MSAPCYWTRTNHISRFQEANIYWNFKNIDIIFYPQHISQIIAVVLWCKLVISFDKFNVEYLLGLHTNTVHCTSCINIKLFLNSCMSIVICNRWGDGWLQLHPCSQAPQTCVWSIDEDGLERIYLMTRRRRRRRLTSERYGSPRRNNVKHHQH